MGLASCKLLGSQNEFPHRLCDPLMQSPHIINIQCHVLKCTEQEQLALLCLGYFLGLLAVSMVRFAYG